MRALSLAVALILTPLPALAAPAFDELSRVGVSADERELTLELRATKPLAFVDERPGGQEWSVFLPGVASSVGRYPLGDALLPELVATRTPTGTRFSVPWARWCPTRLDRPEPRVVRVTFAKRHRMIQQRAIAPGVLHQHWRLADESGALSLQVLRFDPRRKDLRFRPAMAGFQARATTSAIARQVGAFAAVNAGFFHIERKGEPLGLLVLDRRLVAQPVANRAALLFHEDGHVSVAHVQFEPVLTLPTGERRRLDGFNEPREANRLFVYNEAYGAASRTPAGGVEFRLAPDGTVSSVSDHDTPIPPGGYVLSGEGEAARWLSERVHAGDRVKLDLPWQQAMPGVVHAVGAGPELAKAGRVTVTAQEERTPEDIRTGIAPRTACGVTSTGEVILLVADGRQPKVSRGLTLAETAALLVEMGAQDAINLDGGGSSAMVVGPGPVNSPSDGKEREVNNALVLIRHGGR